VDHGNAARARSFQDAGGVREQVDLGDGLRKQRKTGEVTHDPPLEFHRQDGDLPACHEFFELPQRIGSSRHPS